MRKVVAVAIFALFSLSLSGNIFAETNATDDEWHFMVAPLFLWGLNIEGLPQTQDKNQGVLIRSY